MVALVLVAAAAAGCGTDAPAPIDDAAAVACRRAVADRHQIPGGEDGQGIGVRRLTVQQSGGSWLVQGESAPTGAVPGTAFSCMVQPDGSRGAVTVVNVTLR